MSDRPDVQVLDAIRELSQIYSDPLSERFYNQIAQLWQYEFVRQMQQQGDPPSRTPSQPQLPAPTVEEFVVNIVEATKTKTEDVKFESHAFKVVQDYEKCRESRKEYWLCLAALLVELASVLVPLARANTPAKDK